MTGDLRKGENDGDFFFKIFDSNIKCSQDSTVEEQEKINSFFYELDQLYNIKPEEHRLFKTLIIKSMNTTLNFLKD